MERVRQGELTQTMVVNAERLSMQIGRVKMAVEIILNKPEHKNEEVEKFSEFLDENQKLHLGETGNSVYYQHTIVRNIQNGYLEVRQVWYDAKLNDPSVTPDQEKLLMVFQKICDLQDTLDDFARIAGYPLHRDASYSSFSSSPS